MSLPGISLSLPGRPPFRIEHLVLDYNGTLARQGILLPGVAKRVRRLARQVAVHVLTADTFGTVRAEMERALADEMENGRLTLDGLPDPTPGDEAGAKLRFLRALGAERCCAVGNGANDRLMLGAAALSFCVMGREGCSSDALREAMICVADVRDALDLLLFPGGCVATLRR